MTAAWGLISDRVEQMRAPLDQEDREDDERRPARALEVGVIGALEHPRRGWPGAPLRDVATAVLRPEEPLRDGADGHDAELGENKRLHRNGW